MARQPHAHDGLIAILALAPLGGVVVLAAIGAMANWRSNIRPPKETATKRKAAPPAG